MRLPFIGTTAWALLRHPAALARVREAPWHLPAAVEEALRWESPVQRTWRIATADVEVAGQRIPAGALVVLLLGAANRDPARFPEPDRFDLDRRAAGHLAFGAGVHACLGAALARLEAQIALATLLRRWPSLRLTPRRLRGRPVTVLPYAPLVEPLPSFRRPHPAVVRQIIAEASVVALQALTASASRSVRRSPHG